MCYQISCQCLLSDVRGECERISLHFGFIIKKREENEYALPDDDYKRGTKDLLRHLDLSIIPACPVSLFFF